VFDDSVYKTTYQHSVSFDNTFCCRSDEVWPVNDTGGRMTRFCIQCNRIIGEKCVQCGMEATANSNGHAVTGVDFDCSSAVITSCKATAAKQAECANRASALSCRRRTRRWRRAESSAQGLGLGTGKS
jgi:hypothetical protein